MKDGMNQKAACIGDDATLAALHFLARIMATNTPAFGRFGALAVNHSSTGGAFTALRHPCILDQVMVDPLQKFCHFHRINGLVQRQAKPLIPLNLVLGQTLRFQCCRRPCRWQDRNRGLCWTVA